MRRALWILFTLGACGDDPNVVPDGGMMVTPDMAEQQCLPQGAVGTFYRRQPNPKLVAGGRTFTDSKIDLGFVDPSLHWDDAGQKWHLYYATAHATAFNSPASVLIRHATSTNLTAWTFDDAPSLAQGTGSWDTQIGSPSVVYNPDAPADRRYMMFYTGSSAAFPYASFSGPDSSIGAAISADGTTFTRVTTAQSPHGQAGLVFTGAQAHSGALDAIVSDPDVVLVGGVYHMWFHSFACTGASCATVETRGIGHATSSDGLTWSIEAAPVLSLLRSSSDKKSGGRTPSVIYDDVYCRWEMWLASDSPATENDNQTTEDANMVGLWHASSTNATSWTINYSFARDFVWDGAAAGEGLGLREGADVARKGTGRYMLYTGHDDQNVPANSTLETRAADVPGVMTLNLATRDAPP